MVCKTGICSIYSALVELGAVASRKEFCEQWLGRGESYLRVIRHNGKEPSIAALAACIRKLNCYIGGLETAGAKDADIQPVRNVLDACSKHIDERIYGVARG